MPPLTQSWSPPTSQSGERSPVGLHLPTVGLHLPAYFPTPPCRITEMAELEGPTEGLSPPLTGPHVQQGPFAHAKPGPASRSLDSQLKTQASSCLPTTCLCTSGSGTCSEVSPNSRHDSAVSYSDGSLPFPPAPLSLTLRLPSWLSTVQPDPLVLHVGTECVSLQNRCLQTSQSFKHKDLAD